MLVLSRKKNESIVIAGGITITVIEVKRDSVRIGIDAPKTTTVHRLEVAEAIAAEGLKSHMRKQDNGEDVNGD